MKKLTIGFIFFFILMMMFGCEEKTKLVSPENRETQIQYTLTGMENPGTAAKFSLWAATGVSTVENYIGDFQMNAQGNPVPDVFNVNLGVLQKATTLVVSIEEADSMPAEASNSILAAKLVANSATFSVGDEFLLNFDTGLAEGYYQVLKDSNSDSVKGIWFMTGDTAKEAGLGLPEAIPGWRYDAWIVVAGDSFPVGIFSNPASRDGQSEYGLNLPTFPFPGENFEIDPVDSSALGIDLRGAEVLVRILPPVPAYAEKPYQLVIFRGTIPNDAVENTSYPLTNESEDFPGGKAEVVIKLFE